MKRLVLSAVMLSLLCCGLAQGQHVTLDHVIGLVEPDTLLTNRSVIFYIRFTNDYPHYIMGSTNGFVLKSPDGAVWSTAVAEPTGAVSAEIYDGGIFINTFSWDGSGADTVGFGGFRINKPGIPTGFDEVVLTIETFFDESQSGKHFTLDSAFYPPAGAWLWSAVEAVKPSWDGPHDYVISELCCREFVWENCPVELTLDHCQVATFDFDAHSISPDDETHPVTYSLIDGPGTIDSITGVWTYAPSLYDVTQSMELVVGIYDEHLPGPTCFVDLIFTNTAPAFVEGCGENIKVGTGNTAYLPMTAESGDCDPVMFALISVTPTPVGELSINPATGLITFIPDEADAGDSSQFFDITVLVTDGLDSAQCQTGITVVDIDAFAIEIEKTHRTLQGHEETVDITYRAGSQALGGFDFLIAYDASGLSFTGAIEGNIFDDYGWEYFTFRFGYSIPCENGCPSGLLRVVGLAETNDVPAHPSNYFLEPGDVLATMNFMVTSDHSYECVYIPIHYFWMDCGDNSVAFYDLEDADLQLPIQGISRYVFDFDMFGEITDNNTGYPTFTGAQDEDCFVGGPGGLPMRIVDYLNGGVDIMCADEIDARGDVNLNGVAYEIADAVLFANYFLFGTSVFTLNLEAQIATTDINADDIYLSVADLVYLIRVIVGDVPPFPRLVPTSTTYTFDGGRLNISDVAGAGYFVVSGEAVPTLLADNMEMRYNFDGVNTRVLVYSMEKGASFSGDVLRVDGELVQLELATYEGAPMTAKVIPSSYALHQNYPNPFNPSTVVSFDMKKAGDYELRIYNVTGQKVAEYTGHADAGTVSVPVDGSNWSSGVYFYRVATGDFVSSKKMLLLK
jgi:hypothetical protein